MAIAQVVLDCEPQGVAWLRIKDDAGDVWQYNRTKETAPTAPPHVGFDVDASGGLRLALVRGEDRVAILRQDEPGLPEKIIVEILEGVIRPPMIPGVGGWQGRYVYERVDRE